MKKYFLPGLFLIVFNSNAVSQYYSEQKIDSLKKILPSLKDTARIDFLNKLTYFYIAAEQKDSAEHYVTLAWQEAKIESYIHGIAISFSIKAHIARHFDNDYIKSEKLAKESLLWYERTTNKAGIDTAYNYLMYSYFAQSKFEEVIDYGEKSYAVAKQKGDQLKMLSSLSWLMNVYKQTGNYEKSFILVQKRAELALQTNNKIGISTSFYRIGELYYLIEDYPDALLYFRKVLEMDDDETRRRRIYTDNDFWFKMDIGEIFSQLHQFDSAWHYYNLFKPAKDKTVNLPNYWVSTGECYFLQKDYHNALQNFQLSIAENKKLNDRNQVMRALLDIGKTSVALNNNAAALQYGREGLNIALQTKSKQFIRDGYQILYSVYDRWHQTDSAYFYYKKYITMKDIVTGAQVKGKFVAYNYEKKIELLNKEKQIEEAEFKTEAFHKKILIAGIFTLLLLSLVTFRNISLKRRNEAHRREIAENELQLQKNEQQLQKLESEKKQEELQHKATELEMQALRAQMNPHFIFNCLSSINRFILKNETESASDYLTKFSRLIRMVLNNSKKELIPLDDELEMLRLYLEMERMRFKYSFDYNISFKNEIDPENIFIPPLLLQPFAENAIWHGLLNKEDQGHLTVLLGKENNILSCMIEDNGVGRAKAAELKSKSVERNKSLGLQITKERLALLNKDSNETTFFEVEDLYDDKGFANGTRVILKIKIFGQMEEHSLIS